MSSAHLPPVGYEDDWIIAFDKSSGQRGGDVPPFCVFACSPVSPSISVDAYGDESGER